MRLDTPQQMRLQQKLILTPRMIQSMEILQLPVMELQERIQQELQENPALEFKEAAADSDEETEQQPPAPAENQEKDAGDAELVVDAEHDFQLDFDRLEPLGKDWKKKLNADRRLYRGGQDDDGKKKHKAMKNMPSRPQSPHDLLLEQVNLLTPPPHLIELARFLITNLDEN